MTNLSSMNPDVDIDPLVIEKLADGFHVSYALVSGDLILTRGNVYSGGNPETYPISESDFIALETCGAIKMVHTMRQAHCLFHGRVDIYSAV